MSSKRQIVVYSFDVWWEGVPQGGSHPEKALCLVPCNLTSRREGTARRPSELDLSVRAGRWGWRRSFRYTGPLRPFRALKVCTNTLNCAQKRPGSQSRSFKTSVMWSRRPLQVTSLAAAFWISCSFRVTFKGSPHQVDGQ